MCRAAVALLGVLVAASASAQEPAEKWVAPPEEAARPNPVPSSDDALKRGRTVYHLHCATCHGDKGKGDGPYAKLHARRGKPPRDLTLPETQARLTDGEMFWKVTHGLRDGDRVIMPGFETDIRSPDDRWKVVIHVRALARASE
jgi:mono/diheme cytochrome c family protein